MPRDIQTILQQMFWEQQVKMAELIALNDKLVEEITALKKAAEPQKAEP